MKEEMDHCSVDHSTLENATEEHGSSQQEPPNTVSFTIKTHSDTLSLTQAVPISNNVVELITPGSPVVVSAALWPVTTAVSNCDEQQEDTTPTKRKSRDQNYEIVNKIFYYYRIENKEIWPLLSTAILNFNNNFEPSISEKNGKWVVASEIVLPKLLMSPDQQTFFLCPVVQSYNCSRGDIKKQKINPTNFPLIESISFYDEAPETISQLGFEKIQYSSFYIDFVKSIKEIGYTNLFDFVSKSYVIEKQFYLFLNIVNNGPVPLVSIDSVDEHLVHLNALTKVLHQQEYVVPLIPTATMTESKFAPTGEMLSSNNKVIKFCDIFKISSLSKAGFFRNIINTFHLYCNKEMTMTNQLLKNISRLTRVDQCSIDMDYFAEFFIINENKTYHGFKPDIPQLPDCLSNKKCLIYFSCTVFNEIKLYVDKFVIF